jgi:subtilase family protein
MSSIAAEIHLNRVVFTDGSDLSATVSLAPGSGAPSEPQLVLAGGTSGDVEVVRLVPGLTPRTYVTETHVPVVGSQRRNAISGDGVFVLAPNEIFTAFFLARPDDRLESGEHDRVVAAIGLMADPGFERSPVLIVPELAMTDDEREVPEGGKQVGTIASPDGAAVQLPVDELILHPRDDTQLRRFLDHTGGEILRGDGREEGESRSYLIRIDTGRAAVDQLPQLRALFDEREPLLASTPDVLPIYALALQYRIQGFQVGVNPRLQYMARPHVEDHLGVNDVMSSNSGPASPPFAEPVFGVQPAWAFLALWDRDDRRIPIAFLDQGFAPNWDFRGYPGGIAERSIDSGASGPGAATAPPTVGNSFFGSRTWHGNGTVTTAAGVLNNGWGWAGTGGQVAVPLLYKMGLLNYAFEMGRAIRLAVDDGATVINISAGYPCTLVSSIGISFRVCSPGQRAAFCTAITAALFASAAAAAAIPIVGWITGPLAFAAATAAVTACYATVVLGDPRSDMESAVDYATEHGVTIVASAGNQQRPESLGPLCDLIACGPQDVAQWEVVPAVIPGVICAGAADPTDPYANNQFFGDRVDLWAPIDEGYFGPPDVDHVVGADAQIAQTPFGGTSAAAPFIAGIIAMMQAVNPSLDPRTLELTADQRRAIPRRIRDLLVSSSTPSSSLPMNPANPDVARRHNLVSAIGAVRAAAAGVLPDFEGLGYDPSLGFDEATAGQEHDTAANAQLIDALVGGEIGGTILHIPPDVGPGGFDFLDEDWYEWRTPAAAGVYAGGRLELRQPAGPFGAVRVNDQPGNLLSVSPDGLEETREYLIPPQFGESSLQLKVSGFHGGDNPYRLRFYSAMRIGDGPTADRYDRWQTNPAHKPNNDTSDVAIPIGGTDLPWEPRPADGDWASTKFGLSVPDLTFHRADDEDWFVLDPPESWAEHVDRDCRPSLTISAGPGVAIEVFASDGRRLGSSDTGMLSLWADWLQGLFPVRIRLTSPTGGPATFDLEITFEIPSQRFCELLRHLREMARLVGSRQIIIDPLRDPDPSDWIPRFRESPALLLDWSAEGRFRVDVTVAKGQPASLQLVDMARQVVAEARSSAFGGKEPASRAGAETLTLAAERLPPGPYALKIGEIASPTHLEILLPAGAVHDWSASVEDTLEQDRRGAGQLLAPVRRADV